MGGEVPQVHSHFANGAGVATVIRIVGVSIGIVGDRHVIATVDVAKLMGKGALAADETRPNAFFFASAAGVDLAHGENCRRWHEGKHDVAEVEQGREDGG